MISTWRSVNVQRSPLDTSAVFLFLKPQYLNLWDVLPHVLISTQPQHLRPRRILRRESLKIRPRHILRWESWRDRSDSLSLPGGSRDWGAWQINCGSDFPFFPLVCSCFSPTRWLDGSRCLLFVRWETLCLLIGADEQVTRPTTWSPLLFRQSSRKLLLELGTQIVQGWVKHLETFSKQIPYQKLPFRSWSWYLRKNMRRGGNICEAFV